MNLLANTADGTNRAVRSLEAAASESSDAGILSDLSAAYLLRAGFRQDPFDLILALEAAQKSVTTPPILPEALFNRALVLEQLHLRDGAVAAWRGYLAIDPGSPWSAEAKRRLNALASLPTSDLGNSEKEALRTAALMGRRADVLRIVTLSPQSAREHAMNELLPRWGERLLHGDRLGASEELATARAIGETLTAMYGDQTVSGAAAAVDRAVARLPASGSAEELAQAHL
ncbi:MAG TPA: hypothetical protein VJA16_20990, partial [Thermoanaerobaculia bacterium]